MDVRALAAWFDASARELPWREPGTTAWGVLVSEVMLQQTQVARVEPIWREWMARWPTPSALAAAGPGAVLRAWGRLGYPRRALRLHACAVALAASHDDVVPDDVDVLLTLPGVGSYTARAVACFAHGQRVPVVDTNVRRVLARAVHGRAEAGPPSTTRDLVDTAALLPDDVTAAVTVSKALMELGAVVCTARAPRCEECPVRAGCRWVALHRPASVEPRPRAQRFTGTDRQVRGMLMAVLREGTGPQPRAALDVVWPQDAGQRDRALASLLTDGLVEQTAHGDFALAGEGSAAPADGR